MALSLDRIGLILNIAGSILVAAAVGRPESPVYQEIERGRLARAFGLRRYKKQSLAAITWPSALYTGITLLIVGFLASFLATFL